MSPQRWSWAEVLLCLQSALLNTKAMPSLPSGSGRLSQTSATWIQEERGSLVSSVVRDLAAQASWGTHAPRQIHILADQALLMLQQLTEATLL